MASDTQTFTKFRWDDRRDAAAIRVASDVLTDEQIATEAGVTRRALAQWKTHPEFQARIGEIIAETNRRLERQAIRQKTQRVAALHDRWERLRRVIDERAEDREWSGVAGWTTGTLVHRQKQIGGGRDAQIVDEFEVDTGLLAELRQIEKQAAQELGQWVEKSAQTDADGQTLDLASLILKARGDANAPA